MTRVIIYFILFILSSQKFLRKTEENAPSFCFSLNSEKQNIDDDIEIFCSGGECFGIINSENVGNIFSNITVLCNQKSCKITKNTNAPEEGQCNTNERCKNCFEITLICYKGKCIGGPMPIDNENNIIPIDNNENNNEENNNNECDCVCNCDNNEINKNKTNNPESNNNESNKNKTNNTDAINNESNNNESNNNKNNK